MLSNIQKQRGVTLVELLVVLAILAILGGLTGIFLLKYLPIYNLQSAASTLSKDIQFTQINAVKKLESWFIQTDLASQTYAIKDASGTTIKTVDLHSHGGEIRFKTVTGSPITFNAEGFRSSSGPATIELKNSAGSVITTEVLRTGAIRVTK